MKRLYISSKVLSVKKQIDLPNLTEVVFLVDLPIKIFDYRAILKNICSASEECARKLNWLY